MLIRGCAGSSSTLACRGAMMRTPDDPPLVVREPAWYRFALHSPSVAVALAQRLSGGLEKIYQLDHHDPLSPAEYEALAAHGPCVRIHAGQFPLIVSVEKVIRATSWS